MPNNVLIYSQIINILVSLPEIKNSYFILLKDDDPKNTAYIMRLWLLDNDKNQLQTPQQSPDFNLIEIYDILWILT